MDDAIRSLLLLCAAGQWAEVQRVPPAWWETLAGAPLLQALLDAEGDPSRLPPPATAAIRRMGAQDTRQEEAGRSAEAVFLRLEIRYVEREIQANNRLLQDPRTLVDAGLTARIETNQNALLARQRELSRRRRASH